MARWIFTRPGFQSPSILSRMLPPSETPAKFQSEIPSDWLKCSKQFRIESKQAPCGGIGVSRYDWPAPGKSARNTRYPLRTNPAAMLVM